MFTATMREASGLDRWPFCFARTHLINYALTMTKVKKRSSGWGRLRTDLGEYIVADPGICHGKPTFKGTRIMVWQVLDALARGESTDQIVQAWDGKVTKAAIAETVRLAREALLDEQGQLCRPTARRLAA